MSESRIELLQTMPVFGGINESILAFLLKKATTVFIPKDDFFFQEGEAGDSMFVLEEGEVAVIKHWQRHNYVLRQLQRGDAFGEMALIDMFPRSAGVKASTHARAIELTNSLLYELYARDLKQFTMIQMNVAREISRRLRYADDLLFMAKLEKFVINNEYFFHIV
jgi:CRP/FNR family cyclic AMP-dependent transcriptional regulator